MRPAADVLVVGDALLDVQVVPSEPMRPGGDVPAAIRLGPGGQGANVAVRLRRQGLRVRLVCGLGTDAAGTMLTDALRVEDIELATRPVGATGTVVVLLDPDGDRTMLSHRVPLLPLDPGALDGASWLVVSGYVLLEPTAVSLAELAEGVPHRAVAGCALTSAEAPSWMAAAQALRADLAVLNEDEAAILVPDHGPPYRASALAGELADVVVVTGPGRATGSFGDEAVRLRTAGRAAVDATGAGDAFAAGLIVGLVDAAWPPSPHRLEGAMMQAAELASAVAGVPGAQTRVDAEGQR